MERIGIGMERGFWAKNGVGRIVVTVDFELKMREVLDVGFLGTFVFGLKMGTLQFTI